ncbi:MAG: SDR family oxidoreductase [Verrucomicrobia bacterium]|nr:SDR family oxidoreductase [Verrucomicrobiota bacterium]
MSKLTAGVSFDFHGHAVLVTGATGGIGAAIAEGCAAAGANVVIHGRDAAESKPVLEKCRAHGTRVSVVSADFFGDLRQVVPAFIEQTFAAEPGLDMVVTSAGGCIHYGPITDMTFEQYQQLMQLNVASVYFVIQHLARHWLAKKIQGRAVIVGSINGRLAEAYSSMYDSAKGAVEMMVRSFAAELAGQGIRVNGMAPGLVRTPFTRWIDERPDDGAWTALHTPNHVIPGPESCVGASLFLLSDAADHIHGQMLMVDGGMSVWQHPTRPPSLPCPWSVLHGPQGSLKEFAEQPSST